MDVTTCKISPLNADFLRLSQSFLSSKSSALYEATTSSNTVSGTPPVLTFSKTRHTASLGISFSRVITGME